MTPSPNNILSLWTLPEATERPTIKKDTSWFENRLQKILTAKETNFYKNNYEGYETRVYLLNPVKNQTNTVGNSLARYNAKAAEQEQATILPSIITTITPETWELNYTLEKLTQYKCNFAINDAIRGQYIVVAKAHNFFGYLPKTITIKIDIEEYHSLAKPLEENPFYRTPQPGSENRFLKSNFGSSIKAICSDFGLDIKKIVYFPYITEVPAINPTGPTFSTNYKTQRVSDKKGKGELLITTALASDPQTRLRY